MNRVYRQIQSQDRVLGLEVADFLGVIVFFAFSINLSSGIIVPILLTGVAYGVIWSFKRGKPSRWTAMAIGFLRRGRANSAGAPDALSEGYPITSREVAAYVERRKKPAR